MTWGRVAASKRIDIYNSEVGTEVRKALETLEDDSRYITEVSYTADAVHYPEGSMPFVERHLLYLHQHPSVNPMHYLSNLRLKLKIR
ncbi:MAG: hypothetical protein JWP13_703 [Candidatus Saccharibacteria bacterium]|nr:hypothetical protein [Candidatus Saccharibacteria bacterium]